jgi:glycosyltransferase involved in cell wall biosynthesis
MSDVISLLPVGAAEKVVFVPETTAFGGGERVLLALSRYLYDQSIPHRFAWYYPTVQLAPHASWPVREEHLEPGRKPLNKIKALGSYLHRVGGKSAGAVLLVGIQAALHAGLCSARDYSLLILDTPSLLSPPPGEGGAKWKARLRHQVSRPLIRRAMRRARSVMVTTDYMAEEVRRLYGFQPRIVRQGAPAGTFQPRSTKAGEPIRLLSVCRLEPNKRVDWILHSQAELRRSAWSSGHPLNCELDIVGSGGESEALRVLASRLGLDGSVRFHGRVSDARLEELYSRAHLFLMPARQGYGLPALEALSRGLPVVMHQESGVSEILKGTPWVELMQGEAETLREGIRRMAQRLASAELLHEPLPKFPSESEWADEVCRHCGWLA